jgi:hypothetical protein
MLRDGRRVCAGATRCVFCARSISHRGIERCAANRWRVIRSIPILDGSVETRFNELIQKNFWSRIRVGYRTIP